MKKQLFTLALMIVLAIGAGHVMGQGTATAPELGSTKTYTVGGLDNGDTWTFLVSSATENLQDAVSLLDGSQYSFVGASTGTVDGDESAQITWKKAGNYRVWIKVIDATSLCANYRYISVTVADNDFNVSIIALGAGDNTTGDISARTEDANDCPKFINENFENGAGATIGSTYAYFKITRNVNPASTMNWAFTPSITSTADITKWESSKDGVNWSEVTTIGNEFIVNDATGTADYVYFRATATNVIASKTITFDFGSSAVMNGIIADKNSFGSNAATLTLEPLPAIGTFTGL